MDLIAEIRHIFGKKVKNLRKAGLIPAELYGHDVENTHLSVSSKDFKQVWGEAGENTIINLVIGGEKKPVLIHNVVLNYLSGEIEHIDFYRINVNEKIRTSVPIEFVGESPAVKALGGILNKNLKDVEVESLPRDIPHSFSVDISSMTELDQSIYVKDLDAPKGVEILEEPETVVATVVAPVEEEGISEEAEGQEEKTEKQKPNEENIPREEKKADANDAEERSQK